MGSKPKKPVAVVPVAPQTVTDDTKRAVRAAVTAPARGYYDEFAALSRENFDAVLKANAAWADGFEAIASETVGYARQTLAVAGTATRELLAARTLDRVIEIQTGLVKTALEAVVERTARLSELGVALANGTWAPLGGCVETTLTKLGRPVVA